VYLTLTSLLLIFVGEELLVNYGSNYWRRFEDSGFDDQELYVDLTGVGDSGEELELSVDSEAQTQVLTPSDVHALSAVAGEDSQSSVENDAAVSTHSLERRPSRTAASLARAKIMQQSYDDGAR
jgi:hypothetical protein